MTIDTNKLGHARREGRSVYFSETEEYAGACFSARGGNKQVNAAYARRIAACFNACSGISTDMLEIEGTGGLLHIAEATFPERMTVNHLEQQRDDLLFALKAIRCGQVQPATAAAFASDIIDKIEVVS